MNDPRARRRVLWLGALGGGLVLALLFISLALPAPKSTTIPDSPVLHPVSGSVTPEAQTSSETSGSAAFTLGAGDLVSLAWRLGLVILIIAGSIFALRWWGKKTMGPRSATGFLRVVDTLAISNGRSIHLVALGDRVIAVGATQQQLTLLNELSDDEADRVLAEVPREGQQSLGAFAAELFQSMRGDSRPRTNNSATVIGEDLP